MLIKITELNMWERERWHYVLDMEKQGGYVMTQLMIFIRLANMYFEKAKEDSTNAGHGNLFAASRYMFEFFDSMENDGDYNILIHNKRRTICNDKKDSYASSSYDLSRVISPKRIHSAVVWIRDKKRNDLYKNFPSLFLKEKDARKISPVKRVRGRMVH